MRLVYNITRSPLGYLLVALSGDGVRTIKVGDNVAKLTKELAAEYGQDAIEHSPYETAKITKAIHDYMHGERKSFDDIPLDLSGSDFQFTVWERLMEIPYGETISYSDVADDIGMHLAVRAVANACGANPVLLMVPCHRVLRKTGDLGGFSCGLDRKRFLLELEWEHRNDEHTESKTSDLFTGGRILVGA